jgi:5-methyltetrahydrofolate--homocysteine methyltransferase
MTKLVLEELLRSAPVILDGAWGTQLQRRGLPVGGCPDEWNLSHPEKVEEVARAYVEAGSQIILTNTFGSNAVTLERYGLADRVEAINRAGVEISRRAAAGRAKVFASIGPSGVMLMMGDKTPDQLRMAFAVQAEALAQAGADGLVIETMSDPAEALLALEAAKATGLPVAVCMTFDSGKNRDRTMMGTTPEQAAEQLTAAGADVIGANCGAGPETYVQICRRLKSATDRPIWIKPNAGLPEVVNGQTIYRLSCDDFASYVPQLIDAGASFIGGCCGTTPEFIRAICRVLGR